MAIGDPTWFGSSSQPFAQNVHMDKIKTLTATQIVTEFPSSIWETGYDNILVRLCSPWVHVSLCDLWNSRDFRPSV